MSDRPILVIGAGPSGLAAALTLAQNGVPVRIVDKLDAHHTSSRGSGIHPKTVEIFKFLGVIEDAKKFDTGLPEIRAYKHPGGTEVTRQWKAFWDPVEISPERPYNVLLASQYHTEAVLRHALGKFGVRVELSTEPVSMEQDADGVTVTLKKTDEVGGETIEKIRVPYVVGSDGARGTTRKAIGATFEGQTKEEDGQVWADTVVEGLDHDFWHMWSVPDKCGITARPTLNAQSFHVGIFGHNFDPKELLSVQKFIQFVREESGRTDLVFKEIRMLSYWKPKMRMANKFAEGRIFITGDAAHVHSPTGGQGLNTSVQDSFNLAWKLALAYKGLAAPDLLASYEAERLPVVAQMLAQTSKLYTHITSRKIEDVDAGHLETAPGDAAWTSQTLYMLDINYRWSPAVHDARGTPLGSSDEEMRARAYAGYPGGDVRAGDRAPNAPGLVDAQGAETALFDVFKPWRHIVLVFPPGTEEKMSPGVESIVAVLQGFPAGAVKAVVLGRHAVPKAYEGADVYHDATGRAGRAYHVDEAAVTVVVVRPDGYVGAFVYDTEGLQQYFSKVFRCA
uniref:Flavohemoprotein (EC) n=1 Tax=Ganoderma boninense TaxID=34458 RepID=A0A5K1K6Y6_9APHY|nr:Flavohemoprotein (EC [Ganoderma boninense]